MKFLSLPKDNDICWDIDYGSSSWVTDFLSTSKEEQDPTMEFLGAVEARPPTAITTEFMASRI